MRPVTLLAAVLLACERKSVASQRGATPSAAPIVPAPADSAPISVDGPTLIAFYPNVSQAQVDSSEELSTVLDDFSFHLSTGGDSLRRLGFVIVERARGPFHLVAGASSHEFVPAPDSAYVGYVFTAPGRQDRIFYGVMTNRDLIDAGRSFLGLAPRPPA